ncbi:MAG: hypothetical protein IT178_08380 [Acidobacteria bacterium]|nr:hypothetical protein [Acidobacteriota bacterium]
MTRPAVEVPSQRRGDEGVAQIRSHTLVRRDGGCLEQRPRAFGRASVAVIAATTSSRCDADVPSAVSTPTDQVPIAHAIRKRSTSCST